MDPVSRALHWLRRNVTGAEQDAGQHIQNDRFDLSGDGGDVISKTDDFLGTICEDLS